MQLKNINMKNKKLFRYIMLVNNIPDDVFNQRQARTLILTYLFIVVVMVYILNWIVSLLINDLNLPIYVSGIVLAFVITAIMCVKFNLASKFPIKHERLDKLLSQYKPNNPEAYDHLKKETTDNPDKSSSSIMRMGRSFQGIRVWYTAEI